MDIALWDIMGKAVNLPVHKLLGGCRRDKVKLYATGMYIRRSADSPETLAQEAAGYVEKGFRVVKMKVGFGVERDMENVKTTYYTRRLKNEARYCNLQHCEGLGC